MAGGSSEGPSTTNGANKIFENNIMMNCSIGLYYMEDDGLSGGGIYRSKCDVFNNIIYQCDLGVQIRTNADYPDNAQITFCNDIIYGSTSVDATNRPYNLSVDVLYTESHNTWDFADDKDIGSLPWWQPTDTVTVTDNDFESINPRDLSASRQIDGSLPNINFLKLKEDSDLKRAGKYVVMSKSPDIGVDWDF